MLTRCKLRCVTIEHHVYEGHAPLQTALLRPVMGKGSEENVSFWRSTPNGEMRISADGGRFGGIKFEVGAFYYVDIADVEVEGDGWESWQLTECVPSGGGAGASVKLNPAPIDSVQQAGDISLRIDNPYAAAPFARAFMAGYLARCAAYEVQIDSVRDAWSVKYPDRPMYRVHVQSAE